MKSREQNVAKLWWGIEILNPIMLPTHHFQLNQFLLKADGRAKQTQILRRMGIMAGIKVRQSRGPKSPSPYHCFGVSPYAIKN